MKKIFKTLIFSILISLGVFGVGHADGTLTASATGNTVNVLVTGILNIGSDYQLVSTPALPTPPLPENFVKRPVAGTLSWTIPNVPNGRYLIHAIELGFIGTPTNTVTVDVGSGGSVTNPDFYAWPLTYTPSSQGIVVSGKIDKSKYPNTNNLKIRFEIADKLETLKNNNSYDIQPTYNVTQMQSDGTYSAVVTNLTPSKAYFLRQIITTDDNTLFDAKIENTPFTSKGFTPEGSAAAQNDFENRSYRLLAPWPGLSVIMDPSLCASQKAAGKLDPSAICDINALLNYIFKLLVGLTAVVLVLRLIYEGYQYIVTDIPFLKASSKSGFFSALAGLLLALSAYLLLNTINPKLVSNSFNISGINLGVESTFTAGGGTFTGGTATPNANTNITTYDAFLHAAATQYGVEYTLAKAHMYAESSGNPNATSNIKNKAGTVVNHAYGLMQLTKPTFESLGYNFSMIYDPKTNIEAGVKYMGQLKNASCYDPSSRKNVSQTAVCNVSDVQYRIAAYNGGPGANTPSRSCQGKTQWQCDTATDGYAETRNYVAKVLANQQKIIQKNW